METREMEKILSWMRGTDLVELRFKRGATGFEFRTDSAPSMPETPFPGSALVPVVSPGVGFFRFAPPGAPRRAVEGKKVQAGDRLGILETGGKPLEIKAPKSGQVVKVLVQDGDVAEYGQPLLFLKP